jgi:2-keto-3-deoxy-galactonokinase/N-dimethylarginine dimethylaminohydrolase
LTSSSPLGTPNLARALEQHARYCDALRECGLDVTALPPDEQFPDSTFVEDTAVIADRVAIITRPGAPSRSGEVRSIADALATMRPRLEHIEPPGTLDGGDICQVGEHFFIGISARTNVEGARQLAAILVAHGYSCSTIDIRSNAALLHLKTGIAWLGDRLCIVVRGFPRTPELQRYDIIEVDAADAYAANCVRVNDSVLVAAGFPVVSKRLRAAGFALRELEMSEFRKMDGGLSCLSLRLPQPQGRAGTSLMTRPAAIAGDWGTSNLRLFLADDDGRPLATKPGPGAAQVDAPFPIVLSAVVSDWQHDHGELPIVLCGMVGSSIGWTQAPYVPCPADARQIAARCVMLEQGRVRIVPGLSCTNRLDAPDVMRGEETQIIGALQLDANLRRGTHLLCLPGTHTKWAVVNDDVIGEFLTAPTGELFALLERHSVLVSDESRGQSAARRPTMPPTAPADGAAFARALDVVRASPQADLLQRIFQCRSRRLNNDLAPQDASAFMSGLVIGSDAQGALHLMAPRADATVHVIGSPPLTRLYAMALSTLGATPREIDGETAVLAGLMHIHHASRTPGGGA